MRGEGKSSYRLVQKEGGKDVGKGMMREGERECPSSFFLALSSSYSSFICLSLQEEGQQGSSSKADPTPGEGGREGGREGERGREREREREGLVLLPSTLARGN